MTIINGQAQNTINVTDRGLAYGDGLFETIACINQQLHLWPRHWQRLQNGAKRLKLPLPDEQVLLNNIQQALDEKSPLVEPSVVKIIVTRGCGGRGYRPPEQAEAQTIISIHSWPQRSARDYQRGIVALICQTRLARQPLLAGIKHLNRLEQVLAAQELLDQDYTEGLMLEYTEQSNIQTVVEGVSSNVFFVQDEQLYTPEIVTCGVMGTLRNEVIHRAETLGFPVHSGRFELSTLLNAQEVFFTNSIFGILPVRLIINHNNGQPLIHSLPEKRNLTVQLASSLNPELQRPVPLDTI